MLNLIFLVWASLVISTTEMNTCLCLQGFTSCTLWQFGGRRFFLAVEGKDIILLVSYWYCNRRLYSALLIAVPFGALRLFFQSLGCLYPFLTEADLFGFELQVFLVETLDAMYLCPSHNFLYMLCISSAHCPYLTLINGFLERCESETKSMRNI